ncbi:MAG: RT0821/Lpp0805 family surface protein [Pseudolabrys sp.]
MGGLIGNRIGAAMTMKTKGVPMRRSWTHWRRGPSGAPVSWKNPDSGRYGSIVPGPAYQDAGRNCRSFTHTIYIDGRPQTARGTACRNPDGTWTALG